MAGGFAPGPGPGSRTDLESIQFSSSLHSLLLKLDFASAVLLLSPLVGRGWVGARWRKWETWELELALTWLSLL